MFGRTSGDGALQARREWACLRQTKETGPLMVNRPDDPQYIIPTPLLPHGLTSMSLLESCNRRWRLAGQACISHERPMYGEHGSIHPKTACALLLRLMDGNLGYEDLV